MSSRDGRIRAEHPQATSSSPEREDRGTSSASRKRKHRQPLSCAECRRLKLKCDRSVPCTNCIRRSCAEICPDGARQPAKARTEETHDLKARLDALEGLLRCSGIDASSVMEGDRRSVHDAGESSMAKGAKRVRLDLGGTTEEPEPSGGGSSLPKHPAPSPPAHRPQSSHARPPDMTDQPQIQRLALPLRDEGSLPTVSTEDPLHRSSNLLAPTFGNSVYFDRDPPLIFDYGDSTESEHQTRNAAPWEMPTHQPPTIGENRISTEPSSGTLVISKHGGSKYFGHTAASEWLKDQEVQEAGASQSPRPSRPPSPQRPNVNARSSSTAAGEAFPFYVASAASSTATLLASLPEEAEGQILLSSYYRYFAWHFDVAPRSTVQPLFDRMYKFKQGRAASDDRPDCQRLALLFIIFAVGALHNLELPPNDPSADEYLDLAKRSLAKTDFLTHSTVAAVQTLHIMAHYHLETERGRNGDSAWPLWGIAMRLLQAMGLHRDGSNWNLGNDVVEERRSAIAPQYIDAGYPETPVETKGVNSPRHDLLKFELSRLSARVLDHAMRVQTPPYTSVTELHNALVSFERRIPYALRCRAVLMALPSIYFDAETAIRESPEVTRRDLTKTLQQFTLALNVSEAFLFLHRPYFARALHERKPDPTQTTYGQSYLCVVERCNVMIQICAAIYPLHPGVVARHWYFWWYHVFNAAVCMGTLILQNPRNILAPLAMSLIDSSITLYTSIVQRNSTGRLLKNLVWLLRLKHRASTRMMASSASDEAIAPLNPEEEDEDVELLGWRTRLVSRLGTGAQTAVTITPTHSAATPSPNTAMARTIHQALHQHFVPNDQHGLAGHSLIEQPNDVPDNSTDNLLHQFWDPMMLQEQPREAGDLFSNTEWWNWEPDAPRAD